MTRKLLLQLLTHPDMDEESQQAFQDEIDIALLYEKPVVCEHGRGLTDYCEPCGRIHSE